MHGLYSWSIKWKAIFVFTLAMNWKYGNSDHQFFYRQQSPWVLVILFYRRSKTKCSAFESSWKLDMSLEFLSKSAHRSMFCTKVTNSIERAHFCRPQVSRTVECVLFYYSKQSFCVVRSEKWCVRISSLCSAIGEESEKQQKAQLCHRGVVDWLIKEIVSFWGWSDFWFSDPSISLPGSCGVEQCLSVWRRIKQR